MLNNVDLFLPTTSNSSFYNTRIKTFGNDFSKITCFNRNIFNGDKLEIHKSDSELVNQDNSQSNIVFKTLPFNQVPKDVFNQFSPFLKDRSERTDSIKRAKDKVFEIAYSNNFDYFITLTLDDKKIDRTDIKAIKVKLNKWLDNFVQRKNFKYILCPEYHQRFEVNGERAIHFHGLCSGDLNLLNSGKSFKNKPIYNLGNWGFGFSTVIDLDKSQKYICQYITKYITKDNEKILGKYYLSGGPLSRFVPTQYCNIDFDSFDEKSIDVLPNYLKVKYAITDF